MYIIAIGVGMGIACISIFGNLAMEMVRGIVYHMNHMVRATGLPCFAPELTLLIHSERMTSQIILIVSSSNVIFWNSCLSEMNRNEGLTMFNCFACMRVRTCNQSLGWTNFFSSLRRIVNQKIAHSWRFDFSSLRRRCRIYCIIFRGGVYFMPREITIDTSEDPRPSSENSSWYFRAAFDRGLLEASKCFWKWFWCVFFWGGFCGVYWAAVRVWRGTKCAAWA